ncbi:MAG: hypothetical protein ACTHNH_21900 [Mesorhizobium sp.]
MFRIEPTPWNDPVLGKPQKRVIDHERDAWLQFVCSQRCGATVMKLVWHGNVVPFERDRWEVSDEPIGEIWYRSRFGPFGASSAAKRWEGIEPYHFDDPHLRRQAQMLAVEALLVFSGHYNGDIRPDGYDRVEFDGRLYRKSDFGLE